MKRFIVNYLKDSLILIAAASLISFFLIRFMPGDPAATYLSSRGIPITPESLHAVAEELKLYDPVYMQYIYWLKNVIRLDLGYSYLTKAPVAVELFRAFKYTLLLALSSMSMGIIFCLLAGCYAGTHPDSRSDYSIRFCVLTLNSVPSFIIGFLLISVFSVYLHIFPVQGASSFLHLFLPSLTMALGYVAMYTKLLRNSIIDISQKPFVVFAYTRGLKKWEIFWNHIFMNAISPVVTMAGLEFGGIIAGSLVIENVFAWPGLGRLVIIAIHGRDYPVIQGYILLTMTGFIICNFIAETVCMRVRRRWG